MEIKNLIIDEENNLVSCKIDFNYNEYDRGEVWKNCVYYLDQLLGIQCERISNRAKKQSLANMDIHDDICDVVS